MIESILPPRYRLVRSIGRGQQKEVVLARDVVLERLVAISVVRAENFAGSDAERLAEARAMARLGDHPHVVPVYDIIESREALCIVSRYLPGGDLERSLAEGGMPSLDSSLRIGLQIASALEYAHSSDVIHRDVKPGNVFVDDRGTAMLGDFGLSTRFRETASHAGVAGTPLYMAPEVRVGLPATPKSDLYSFGCMLFELIAGSTDFKRVDLLPVLRRRSLESESKASEDQDDIPVVVIDLIRRLLDPDPEKRPESAASVRITLEGAIEMASSLGTDRLGFRSVEPNRTSLARAAFDRDRRIIQREPQIRDIERTVLHARQGTPGIAFVSGESGVGKSRLLGEVRSRAHRNGFITLLGKGSDHPRIPYGPFSDALMPLAGHIGELSRSHADVLRSMLALAPDEHLPEETEAGGSYRLALALFGALESISQDRPLLLMFDDVQSFDSASLNLLDQIASRIARYDPAKQISMALVLSYRELDLDARTGEIIERLCKTAGARPLALEGLDRDGVRELLVQLGISIPSAQLVEQVRHLTNGNPLFIQGLTTQLRHDLALGEKTGFTFSSRVLDEIRVPTTALRVLENQTQNVSDDCRVVLVSASILGMRFSITDLAALTGRDTEKLLDFLDEACRARLLEDLGQSFRFSHPLIRQALYQTSPLTRRQRAHFKAAEILRANGGEDGDRVVEIAYHLIRSGTAASAIERARYASKAALHAEWRYAWSEAAALLENAIEAASELSERERGEFHRRAGFAYYRLFDTGPCLHHLDESIRLFRRGDARLPLARALNDRLRAEVQSGQLSPGQAPDTSDLEDALSGLGSDERALRARILGTLAEASWQAGSTNRAETLALEAVSLAAEVNDDPLCVDNNIRLGLSYLQAVRIPDALAAFEMGLTHARRADDLLAIEHCQQRVAFTLYSLGEPSEAIRAIEEAERVNESTQSPADLAFSLAIHATVASARSDLKTTEALADRCLALIRRTRYPFSAAALLPALACVRSTCGEKKAAHEAIDRLIEPGFVFEDPGPWRATAEQYRALIDGRPPVGVTEPPVGFPLTFASIPAFCASVEICDLKHQSPDEEVVLALECAYRRGLLITLGWPFYVPRLLGVAAGLRGSWDTAETYFAEAAARCRTGDVERSRIELDRARMLLRRNRISFRHEAESLIKRSKESFALKGATTLARSAEKLLAEE